MKPISCQSELIEALQAENAYLRGKLGQDEAPGIREEVIDFLFTFHDDPDKTPHYARAFLREAQMKTEPGKPMSEEDRKAFEQWAKAEEITLESPLLQHVWQAALAWERERRPQADIPLCGSHADSWFTMRNHLNSQDCVVCAFQGADPSPQAAEPAGRELGTCDVNMGNGHKCSAQSGHEGTHIWINPVVTLDGQLLAQSASAGEPEKCPSCRSYEKSMHWCGNPKHAIALAEVHSYIRYECIRCADPWHSSRARRREV